jgi:hypothetical protein
VTKPFESSLLGDCVAAVEEARAHGYSVTSAVAAALDHLETATRTEAIVVAAILAGWIATDLNPTTSLTNLEDWVVNVTAMVAHPESS